MYKYLVVLFGEKSSPFIAYAVCKHHANRKDVQIECPAAAQVVLNNELYMDDTITGCETPKQAIELYHQLKVFFNAMSMKLHKFNSNSTEFLNAIEESDKSEENEVDLVLGMKFDTTHDKVFVNNKPANIKQCGFLL